MSMQQYRHCGKKLSPDELVEFLTDQHAAMVDDPIMLWLSMSLEDMADVITRAIKCSESAEFDAQADAIYEAMKDANQSFIRGMHEALPDVYSLDQKRGNHEREN